MKSIQLHLLLIIGILFTSCSQNTLPSELIQDEQGYTELSEYIYSHYPELEDNIEVLEFSYSAGLVSSHKDVVQSSISLDFVRGDNKDRIVNYRIDSNRLLTNNNVDISVGEAFNQKLSNSYETYKPFLFSSDLINLTNINNAISKSIELFKEDANVQNAICSMVRIEKKGEQPILSIRIEQNKFASTISRSYDWSVDGQNQIK